MNIFVLDENKETNAKYYVNKHVVKMILEYTQILSSVYYFTDFIPRGIYKLYGKNHPTSIWARESLDNWLWLKEMADILIKEYEYRFKKTHKCKAVLQNMPLPNLEQKGLTTFPQVMPKEYQQKDIYKAYQTYYIKEKFHLFSWKNREVPEFILNSFKQ